MKTAIILGGSGGIGGATARAFAGAGYTPILSYRGQQAAAEALAAELGGAAFPATVLHARDLFGLT